MPFFFFTKEIKYLNPLFSDEIVIGKGSEEVTFDLLAEMPPHKKDLSLRMFGQIR